MKSTADFFNSVTIESNFNAHFWVKNVVTLLNFINIMQYLFYSFVPLRKKQAFFCLLLELTPSKKFSERIQKNLLFILAYNIFFFTSQISTCLLGCPKIPYKTGIFTTPPFQVQYSQFFVPKISCKKTSNQHSLNKSTVHTNVFKKYGVVADARRMHYVAKYNGCKIRDKFTMYVST